MAKYFKIRYVLVLSLCLFFVFSVFAVPNAWQVNVSGLGYGIYNYNISTTIPQIYISYTGKVGMGVAPGSQKLTVAGIVNGTNLIGTGLGACTGRLRSTINGTIFCDNTALPGGDITLVTGDTGMIVTGGLGSTPSIGINFTIVANKSWVSAMNTTVVHILGTETITGNKTFSASTKVSNFFNASNYYIGNSSLLNCTGRIYTSVGGKFLCGVDAGANAIVGTGGANYLAYWNDVNNVTWKSTIYMNGRKLGLNYASPRGVLHIFNGTANAIGMIVNMTNNNVGSSTIAGYFVTGSETGQGVYGFATKTGAVSARGGVFLAQGDNGVGLYGKGTGVYTNGVQGSTNSATRWGVVGNVSGVSAIGVFGTCSGATCYGVYGGETTSGSINYGGYFTAAGTIGRAVFANATSTSGVNYGLYAATASASGYAVYTVGGANYLQGKVGIGVVAPSLPLEVSGIIKTKNLTLSGKLSCAGKLYTNASGSVLCGTDATISGTLKYIPYFNTASTIAASGMYYNGSGYGFGTTTVSTGLVNINSGATVGLYATATSGTSVQVVSSGSVNQLYFLRSSSHYLV